MWYIANHDKPIVWITTGIRITFRAFDQDFHFNVTKVVQCLCSFGCFMFFWKFKLNISSFGSKKLIQKKILTSKQNGVIVYNPLYISKEFIVTRIRCHFCLDHGQIDWVYQSRYWWLTWFIFCTCIWIFQAFKLKQIMKVKQII